jgi:WhiB family redox-sensing transcriptional regulator
VQVHVSKVMGSQASTGTESTPAPARVSTVHWLFLGACRNEDPELFFPIGRTGPAEQQIEDAKRVCRRCDVVDACLEWAVRSGQNAGVWGGLSEDERHALQRGRRYRSRTEYDVLTDTPHPSSRPHP